MPVPVPVMLVVETEDCEGAEKVEVPEEADIGDSGMRLPLSMELRLPWYAEASVDAVPVAVPVAGPGAECLPSLTIRLMRSVVQRCLRMDTEGSESSLE
jgi:hypothetical protein